MIYESERVKRDVRVCLDHNMSSAPLLDVGDVDTLSVDEVIASKLEAGARLVAQHASLRLLESGHTFADAAVHWRELESGWVLLPDDFLRLVSYKMSDWEAPVCEAIGVGDPGYAVQRGRVKALRGTPQRPVCAIVQRPEGLALEFYSSASADAEIEQAQYVAEPKVDAYGGIDISERCYQATVYAVAALAAQTLGEAETGKALMGTAQALME